MNEYKYINLVIHSRSDRNVNEHFKKSNVAIVEGFCISEIYVYTCWNGEKHASEFQM